MDFRDPENVKKVRSGEETFGGWSQFATRERERERDVRCMHYIYIYIIVNHYITYDILELICII